MGTQRIDPPQSHSLWKTESRRRCLQIRQAMGRLHRSNEKRVWRTQICLRRIYRQVGTSVLRSFVPVTVEKEETFHSPSISRYLLHKTKTIVPFSNEKIGLFVPFSKHQVQRVQKRGSVIRHLPRFSFRSSICSRI